MKKLWLALALCLGLAPAQAQNTFDQSTQATAFFSGTQAATRVITAVAGKRIYFTQLTATGAATAVLTITRGTGTNCGTGTVTIYTATFAAGDHHITAGSGNGAIAVIGTGVDVCITVATASATGWLSWAQF